MRFPQLGSLGELGEALTQLTDPVRLPLWQVMAAFNALLAWAYFFHADVHLLARGTAEGWPKSWIRRENSFVTATRCTISLYSIACTFYVIATVAWNMEWPKVRLILFPWSG